MSNATGNRHDISANNLDRYVQADCPPLRPTQHLRHRRGHCGLRSALVADILREHGYDCANLRG